MASKFARNPRAWTRPEGGYRGPPKSQPSYATGGSDATGKARDLLNRQHAMEHVRMGYEKAWQSVTNYIAPDAPEITRYGYTKTDNQASRSERRSRNVYDVTIRIGSRRLEAGLESLITPQNDYWHGFTTANLIDPETDEEKEWAESVRDYLFGLRYTASTSFVPSIQQCYRNLVRYGPAYLYPEENVGLQSINYRSLPVAECWIARDKWGVVDTLHRKYRRSARVCVQEFGANKLPTKIVDMANDPAQQDEMIELLHAIYPKKDRQTYDIGGVRGYLDGPFASCHVIIGDEHVAKEMTFSAFPVACFSWLRDDNDDYGTSPCIEMLTEVREINAISRSTLRGVQQMMDPSLALGGKLDTTPALDAGSRHPGLIDEQGRQLFAPLNQGIRPDYALQLRQESKRTISEGMYTNLFQVLSNDPQKTATEALIRNEEKGALLGPAGSSIQGGLSMLTDREMSILDQQGIYEAESRFAPPESLGEKTIRPVFTSPLDILRKTAEGRAVVELWTVASQFATVDPQVMDNLDGDESLRVYAQSSRAPQRVLRRREEVVAKREADAAAAKQQQGMAGIAAAASAAKDAVPAMAQAAEAGLLPGLGSRAAPGGS